MISAVRRSAAISAPLALKPASRANGQATGQHVLGIGDAHDRRVRPGQPAENSSRAFGGHVGEQHDRLVSVSEDATSVLDGAFGAVGIVPAQKRWTRRILSGHRPSHFGRTRGD
jgi:hypothetical protein